jgi:hypothetical protein
MTAPYSRGSVSSSNVFGGMSVKRRLTGQKPTGCDPRRRPRDPISALRFGPAMRAQSRYAKDRCPSPFINGARLFSLALSGGPRSGRAVLTRVPHRQPPPPSLPAVRHPRRISYWCTRSGPRKASAQEWKKALFNTFYPRAFRVVCVRVVVTNLWKKQETGALY